MENEKVLSTGKNRGEDGYWMDRIGKT